MNVVSAMRDEAQWRRQSQAHIQRPPLTEDAKKIIERILADEGTLMKTGYRAALMAMCEAS